MEVALNDEVVWRPPAVLYWTDQQVLQAHWCTIRQVIDLLA